LLLFLKTDRSPSSIHLGEPAPEQDRPSVMERLAKTYAAAL
jgi:hypothetical protein